MGLNRGDVMSFNEWFESDATIIRNDIEFYDLETAYKAGFNKAIEEAIKAAEDAGAFYSTIKSIKELKE